MDAGSCLFPASDYSALTLTKLFTEHCLLRRTQVSLLPRARELLANAGAKMKMKIMAPQEGDQTGDRRDSYLHQECWRNRPWSKLPQLSIRVKHHALPPSSLNYLVCLYVLYPFSHSCISTFKFLKTHIHTLLIGAYYTLVEYFVLTPFDFAS